jgi:glycosyltransferase involved in cell wall biosynthesis
MSGTRKRVGPMLFKLSAWIHREVRRQPWLVGVYRRFPLAVRSKVREELATHTAAPFKFERTPNWDRRVQLPTPVPTGVTPRAEFGEKAGVNVFAYARGQFGLGECARLYVRALLAEGYPVAVHDIDIGLPHGLEDTSLDQHIGEDMPHGVNLIFVNPDYLQNAIASIGPERLANRHTIGCWFWELENFPDEWLPALQLVDEFMVSSTFIGEVIGPVTDKPILHVPLPVNEASDSGLTRADFGLEEDAFVFLNSFDFNSFLARKNPFAVIDAFRRAFADDRSDVRLLIKTSNGHRQPDKFNELLSAVAGDRRILVRDEVIDRSHVQALQRCADAYVSLHRAEGFGLGLAECMRQGKPVVATAWSGNLEFMTPENSCLVDYRLVPVGEGEYLYHVGQRWADPDIDHAASYMRRLADDRDFAARIGAQAALDIRDKLSPHAAAERIIRRVKELTSYSETADSADAGSATGAA